jgi:hypothetical protein
VFQGVARGRYRHLTPRYVFDRVRVLAHERRHPEAPWLTAAAVAFLERWLDPALVSPCETVDALQAELNPWRHSTTSGPHLGCREQGPPAVGNRREVGQSITRT